MSSPAPRGSGGGRAAGCRPRGAPDDSGDVERHDTRHRRQRLFRDRDLLDRDRGGGAHSRGMGDDRAGADAGPGRFPRPAPPHRVTDSCRDRSPSSDGDRAITRSRRRGSARSTRAPSGSAAAVPLAGLTPPASRATGDRPRRAALTAPPPNSVQPVTLRSLHSISPLRLTAAMGARRCRDERVRAWPISSPGTAGSEGTPAGRASARRRWRWPADRRR